VLDSLPPCFLHKPIGDIDLEAGCADDVCQGDTIEAWIAQLDAEPECEGIGGPYSNCVWEGWALAGLFDDEDNDGQPDAEGRTDRVHLLPGHAGSTLDGLGTEQAVRCWVDALGTPDLLTFDKVAGSLMIEELYYDDLGLYVYDWEADDGRSHADGEVDNVFLFGAP
jgi:hypothetical protein